MRKQAALVASPATKTTEARTAVFAASSVRRRGSAAKDVLIMCVLYSEVIASTARTAAAIAPNQRPARLSSTMSLSPGRPGLPPVVSDPQHVKAVKSSEVPTRIMSDHAVLRTVRSLIHSARRGRSVRARRGTAATASTVTPRSPSSAPRRTPPGPA